jgi:Cysteine-rich secretory protein family
MSEYIRERSTRATRLRKRILSTTKLYYETFRLITDEYRLEWILSTNNSSSLDEEYPPLSFPKRPGFLLKQQPVLGLVRDETIQQINSMRHNRGITPLLWSPYLILAAYHHATYLSGVTTDGLNPQQSNTSVTNSPFGSNRARWLFYVGFSQKQPTGCKIGLFDNDEEFIASFTNDAQWRDSRNITFGYASVPSISKKKWYVWFTSRQGDSGHPAPKPDKTYIKIRSGNEIDSFLWEKIPGLPGF